MSIRIETELSHDAIDLIDALRAHGIEARLADSPGTWEVEADASLRELAPIQAEQLAAHEAAATAVHADGNLYVVEVRAVAEREAVAA